MIQLLPIQEGQRPVVTALAQQHVKCKTLILISPMAAGVPDWALETGAVIDTTTTFMDPLSKVVQSIGAAIGLVDPTTIVPVTADTAKAAATKNYKTQIDNILNSNPPAVNSIVIIQSPADDKLIAGNIYQYRFS